MIASVDVEAKHRKLQSLRFHGTGEWLLQNDKYLEWKHASGPSSLCCYGIRKYGMSLHLLTESCTDIVGTPYSWVWQKRSNVCIDINSPADTATDDCFSVGHESLTTSLLL